MTYRQRKNMFHLAVELWHLKRVASCGGLSTKMADLDRFISNGGKVQPGAMFPDAQRSPNDSAYDWALSFIGKLPEERHRRTLILEMYSESDMPTERYYRARRVARDFWDEIRESGLDADGRRFVALRG